MKKVLLFCVMCLVAGNVFAGAKSFNILDGTSSTVLEATSSTVEAQEFEQGTFFLDYYEQQVGNNIGAVVYVDGSYSSSIATWSTVNFYDAVNSTPQTSHWINSNGDYVFWLNPDTILPYVRVRVVAEGTDADDTLGLIINFTGKK